MSARSADEVPAAFAGDDELLASRPSLLLSSLNEDDRSLVSSRDRMKEADDEALTYMADDRCPACRGCPVHPNQLKKIIRSDQ